MHDLYPFSPCPAVEHLSASIRRTGDALSVEWILSSDAGAILWPRQRSPKRATGLWHHTCFELFLGPHESTGYVEFNLSTAGNWNAFHFTDVRTGMTETDLLVFGDSGFKKEGDRVIVRAELRFIGYTDCALKAGIAAVIEDRDESLHYFALAHGARKPDFHDRANHTIILEASRK